MASAPRKGLNNLRNVGSSPDNKGINDYTIASGYNTNIGVGDPVKLSSGTLVLATNGADAIGVFQGVSYTDSFGAPVFKQYWPANTVATNIVAYVCDAPFATFSAVANSEIPLVVPGNIFAMNGAAMSAATGRSQQLVNTMVEITGDVDLSAMTDLGEDVTGLDDNDTFTIRTTQTVSATTITIEDGDGPDELLEKLNAVDNISAELNDDGFLVIRATDGYNLVIAEGTGTPYADLFAGAAGTFTEVVAANAGMVKVISVLDAANKVLEVVLVNHSLRDDG